MACNQLYGSGYNDKYEYKIQCKKEKNWYFYLFSDILEKYLRKERGREKTWRKEWERVGTADFVGGEDVELTYITLFKV